MNTSDLFDAYTWPSGLETRNRLVMAPMTTWSSHGDGRIHPDEIEYLRRRSSGLGMVITAAAYVQPIGHAFPGQWSCHDDSMIPSLRAAADVIHAEGSKAILQIHHGGRMCPASLIGTQPVSAGSEAANRPDADTPRPMTGEEIEQCITAFAAATQRAIEADFDGVEIHGANTYLLQQFFSPHSNRRADEWGGSLEKRMRFPLAVTDAVLAAAEKAGRPFAVGYRVSPEEIEEPGITISDTLQLVEALATRPLDWLHVSVRSYFAGSMRDDSDTEPPTRRIITQLDGRLPVIGVGLVYTPDEAAALLEDGCAAVALGRILLMEPDWPEKVRSGKVVDIRHALPASGGEKQLTLPAPMYRKLLSRAGWLPLE